jgi:hypothetical protein
MAEQSRAGSKGSLAIAISLLWSPEPANGEPLQDRSALETEDSSG